MSSPTRQVSRELRKYVAPEFVFGWNALDLAGQYAARLGTRRLLLVTDPGVREAGWPSRIGKSLQDAGVSWVEFSAVTPNPRITEVVAGAEVYTEEKCDGILAVGGGSPIDCGKGVGVVVSNGGSITDYEGVDRVEMPMPPVLCIPTTCGTGADVSQFAILTDRAQRRKLALVSKALVPDLALVDPGTLATLPPFLRACTGMDALVHACEAYVSTGHSPFTDVHALMAVRLLADHLRGCVETRELAGEEATMQASLQAGIAFSNASLGLVHAMAHALGGLLDLPHGECNAILLEHVIGFNFEAAAARYRQLAEALGVEVAGRSDAEVREALVACVRALRVGVGLGRTLQQAGMRSSDIPELTRNALRDACVVTNPRAPREADIQAIYAAAL